MGQYYSTQNPTFGRPWRPVNWSDKGPMLKTLKEFQASVDHLRILVVGPAGAGKSAFITSVNNAIQGRNTCLAHSLTGGSSATCKYTVYKLNKDAEGSFFPFVLCDTMGLQAGHHGVRINDIVSILQGRMMEGYAFNPGTDLCTESNNSIQSPNITDKVHCLVFVIPADNIGRISEEINKMKLILQEAHELEIPVAVIMSKVDAVCPLVQEDLTMIYKSRKIKEKMEQCSVCLGVPMKQIFPVKNYHEEITTNTEADILILMAVTNILNFASDFVKASDNPWRPVNWSVREQMLQTLREFQANESVDHLRILVVGPAGAGKSAFITTVNTALQGRNTYLAHSLTGGSSATCKYTVYKLNKDTEGSFFPFVLGDTMGLEAGDNGVHTNDIVSILQGHMMEGYTFNPSMRLTSENDHLNQNPCLNDRVHCLVFVLPADTSRQTPQGTIEKIKLIQGKANELEIPVVVVLSKVDAACSLVKQNLTMTYRSKDIQQMMMECGASLHIPVKYIYPVKNYHEEITTNTEADILILMALTDIVNFANDYVKRKRDLNVSA